MRSKLTGTVVSTSTDLIKDNTVSEAVQKMRLIHKQSVPRILQFFHTTPTTMFRNRKTKKGQSERETVEHLEATRQATV